MGYARLLPLALCLAGAAPALAADPPPADDRFLAGIATAVLEREFGLNGIHPVVKDGRLWLDPKALGRHDPEKVRAALDGLHGLHVVLAAPPQQLAVPQTSVLPRPAAWRTGHLARTGFLPEEELFEPPVADPRSPAISGAVLWHLDGGEVEHAARVDFGGSLPLYGWRMADGLWQVGLQGGVFSIFDIGRSPTELLNADYLIALPLETRYGDLGARLRVLHQSSHLGDEFLLRTREDRVNLSYEAVDLLLAYDLGDDWRIYGGGSSLIRKNPDDLKRFGAQAGLEYKSARPMLTPLTYPLAAVDVRSFEETDWDANVSARAGVELRNGFLAGTRIQLLAEYFNGRSPHGQFYDRSIEYLGLGLRVLF